MSNFPTVTPTIEIFRTGRFTSVEGTEVSFSLPDLQGIVDGYDPSTDPAPLVVGHPKLDAPAYGWVDRLVIENETLVAVPKDVEPAFGEMVNAGRFRRVSAQFYDPAAPGNPKPGSFYLKHVGFLGAAAPAVKGLKTVAFGEADAASCATFEIDLSTKPQENLMATEELKRKEISFAERETALEKRERELGERETANAAAAQQTRHRANVSFAEVQVGAGKLSPAGKDLVVLILDGLDEGKTISFGEKGTEITPADAFRKLFDTAAPIVSFGEFAKGDLKGSGGEEEAPADIAARAVSFAQSEAAAGRTISVAAAVRHVQKQGG